MQSDDIQPDEMVAIEKALEAKAKFYKDVSPFFDLQPLPRYLRDGKKQMQKYDVKLPNEFVLMARGLSMVENLGLRLDPNIDVVSILKPFARKLMVQRYNPFKMAINAKNSFFTFEHVLRSLPSLISKTIYKIEEGEVTVNIEVKHISEIANQLSLAIIIAALLVGSSLVMLVDVGPRFYGMPVLGFVGFTISLALGVFTVLRYFIEF